MRSPVEGEPAQLCHPSRPREAQQRPDVEEARIVGVATPRWGPGASDRRSEDALNLAGARVRPGTRQSTKAADVASQADTRAVSSEPEHAAPRPEVEASPQPPEEVQRLAAAPATHAAPAICCAASSPDPTDDDVPLPLTAVVSAGMRADIARECAGRGRWQNALAWCRGVATTRRD